MNNEEKILSLLTQVVTDVSGLKSDFAELKSDVAVLKSDVAELKSDVAVLKSDVAELKSDVAVLKSDVAELKVTQELHTMQIAELRAVQKEHSEWIRKYGITMEQKIIPRLDTLYEGYLSIRETMATKEDIAQIWDELSTQRASIKLLGARMTKVEQAVGIA